jgi:hypothetical protein
MQQCSPLVLVIYVPDADEVLRKACSQAFGARPAVPATPTSASTCSEAASAGPGQAVQGGRQRRAHR